MKLPIVLCCTVLMLAGCQTIKQMTTPTISAEYVSHEGLWDAIRDELSLEFPRDNPRIELQRQLYLKRLKNVNELAAKAEPYLEIILKQIKERDMPIELVLLPVVESAFDPKAKSSANAVGLWQLTPSTGLTYGLVQNQWYDGRYDIIASTGAALDMLKSVNKTFNGDWLLTMAAYNTGAGNILKAVKANEKAGKPTDFWSLKLPKETEVYVPRLFALSDLIRHHDDYNIDLPTTNPANSLVPIALPSSMLLSQIAQFSGLTLQDIQRYNPSYLRGMVPPEGLKTLLLPRGNVEIFQASLASKKTFKLNSFILSKNEGDATIGNNYTVKSGDTLSLIADKFNIALADLMLMNDFKATSKLYIGQTMKVSTVGNQSYRYTYIVEPGDNLSLIAKKHGVSVSELRKWNNLKLSPHLRAGMPLKIILKGKTRTIANGGGATRYTVKSGDTLGGIALKFKTNTSNLKKWNKLNTQGMIRIGQTLKVSAGLRKVNYTVRKGDTLYTISKRYKISSPDIMAWNMELQGNHIIQPGSRLVLYVH